MEGSWKAHGRFMEGAWKVHGGLMEGSWKIHGRHRALVLSLKTVQPLEALEGTLSAATTLLDERVPRVGARARGT